MHAYPTALATEINPMIGFVKNFIVFHGFIAFTIPPADTERDAVFGNVSGKAKKTRIVIGIDPIAKKKLTERHPKREANAPPKGYPTIGLNNAKIC